jgi:hypothetical protein
MKSENMVVEDNREYLFTEVEDFNVEMITESSKSGEKVLYVEGIAMQADVINANGRNYPLPVMTEAVDAYVKQYVEMMQALGECDHPPRPNVLLQEASHLIERIWQEGSDVYARAKVLNTPRGQVVRALIEGGWTPRVSTRGLGKAVQINESKSKFGRPYTEITKFQLTAGFDFVHNQSAPGAVMAGVYESNGSVYVPLAQKESVDWDQVAFRFKQMAGLVEPIIVESASGEAGLKLFRKGNQLVIECDSTEWTLPVKDLKKYLG